MNVEAIKRVADTGKVLTAAQFKELDVDPVSASSPKQAYADDELVGRIVTTGRQSFTIEYEPHSS